MFSWSYNRFQSQNLKNKEIKLWELQFSLLTECHYCDKTVILYPIFSVKWLSFKTSHDSVNFSLWFKTVYRILSGKMRILAFLFFHTWDYFIFLNLINYFHQILWHFINSYCTNSVKSVQTLMYPSGIPGDYWNLREVILGAPLPSNWVLPRIQDV